MGAQGVRRGIRRTRGVERGGSERSRWFPAVGGDRPVEGRPAPLRRPSSWISSTNVAIRADGVPRGTIGRMSKTIAAERDLLNRLRRVLGPDASDAEVEARARRAYEASSPRTSRKPRDAGSWTCDDPRGPLGARRPMTPRYRLSRLEYERAVEAGVFEPDARLELVDGELLAKPRQTPGEATAINLVESRLREAFADYHVRMRHPLAVDDYSEPEPDLAVVTGAIRDYVDAHPTTAALVVEVSDDTTLQQDRTVKQRVYARCGTPEYWVLAVPDAHLEVYRDPADDGYRTVTTYGAGDVVAPLARPDVELDVRDLLP